jgi:flavin reductase (DIM6/NTAB) family NADH-FMN oxidoreductase RutF
MPLDSTRFRQVLGQLPTGVTVVTARIGAEVIGMTASSVASVSLDPPLVLVCVGHTAEIHQAIVSAPIFGINVLAADQQSVAVRFADRARQRFSPDEGHPGPAGLPLVDGALAHLECRRAAVYAGGDHSIVLGAVEWAQTRDGKPLCYFHSSYRTLSSE